MNQKESTIELDKSVLNKIENEENAEVSEKFLDEKDIEKMVNSVENVRDSTLLFMLWETGARISELYDISLNDIEEKGDCKKVNLNGFNGARKIPISKSVPLLEDWISKHPNQEDRESSLWMQGSNKITYNYIREMLKKAGERADTNKMTHPQHFRRSRAALLAKILPEDQVKNWFGWKEKSDLEGLEKGCSDCAGCPFQCGAF